MKFFPLIFLFITLIIIVMIIIFIMIMTIIVCFYHILFINFPSML